MWNTALIFSNENHGLQKKIFFEQNYIYIFLSVDYIKIIELHVVHAWHNWYADNM